MPCDKKKPIKIDTRKIKKVNAVVKEASTFIIKQALVEMVKRAALPMEREYVIPEPAGSEKSRTPIYPEGFIDYSKLPSLKPPNQPDWEAIKKQQEEVIEKRVKDMKEKAEQSKRQRLQKMWEETRPMYYDLPRKPTFTEGLINYGVYSLPGALAAVLLNRYMGNRDWRSNLWSALAGALITGGYLTPRVETFGLPNVGRWLVDWYSQPNSEKDLE